MSTYRHSREHTCPETCNTQRIDTGCAFDFGFSVTLKQHFYRVPLRHVNSP